MMPTALPTKCTFTHLTATFNANTSIVQTIYNYRTNTDNTFAVDTLQITCTLAGHAHYCLSLLKNTMQFFRLVQKYALHWPPVISLGGMQPNTFLTHVSTKRVMVCKHGSKVSMQVETCCVHKRWHPRKEKPHIRAMQFVRYWQELSLYNLFFFFSAST